ncbi:DUF4306 domain-containing protein [Planococcus sp. S3-L1]|uniref:DUF4306 domain-containing protein n=1 Tax=Planococcus sp. S3-L1 TaxID=3046200 RepID=UPI0024BBB397|nr:DUF4306 domain-containing protein [Planococcus sp. S3-L1]MDJ0333561.1 DUF4306 domain-containing protein [Planococcus sp. S3-L1]
MSFKKVILLIGAFLLFFFTSLISWYEGGQLRDDSIEWKYTAIFSNWINGEITTSSDILIIDHFVYAAKYEPLYPILMTISFFYVIFQLAFLVIKKSRRLHNTFLGLIAVGSFTICILLLNSPTTGFKLFTLLFGLISLFSIIKILIFEVKKKKLSITQVN